MEIYGYFVDRENCIVSCPDQPGFSSRLLKLPPPVCDGFEINDRITLEYNSPMNYIVLDNPAQNERTQKECDARAPSI